MSAPFALDLSDVFAHVDANRAEFFERLVDYLRRPSISAHGEGIAETADFIADVLRQIGLKTRVIPTAGWPVVLAEHCAQPGKPTVLLYGHYDVQPPDPLDEWRSPPFEPTLRDGRLYARGVGDNKGQHFAQILALESLLATRGALPCNVKVLLEGEEEIGSPQLAAFVRAERAALAADLVITSDGPVDDSGRSRILFGVRGVLSFELRAREANRDLHSGNWGGVAPNPLWTLVHLLATMKNARGEVTIPGFYDAVPPLTGTPVGVGDRVVGEVSVSDVSALGSSATICSVVPSLVSPMIFRGWSRQRERARYSRSSAGWFSCTSAGATKTPRMMRARPTSTTEWSWQPSRVPPLADRIGDASGSTVLIRKSAVHW
jgi:acetylornithine deacetylase/succinyl-diaminopimelate desuccinylase-like protein